VWPDIFSETLNSIFVFVDRTALFITKRK
jgi:hypothetical protein